MGRGFAELSQIEIEANGPKVVGGQIHLSTMTKATSCASERVTDRSVRWHDGRETFTQVKSVPNADYTDHQRKLDLQILCVSESGARDGEHRGCQTL
jgi:hypothetical protein